MNEDAIVLLRRIADATLKAIPKRKRWTRGWTYDSIGKPKYYIFSFKMPHDIANIYLVGKSILDLQYRLERSFAYHERKADRFIGFLPLDPPIPGSGSIGIKADGEKGLCAADTPSLVAFITYDLRTLSQVVIVRLMYQAFRRTRTANAAPVEGGKDR
jgi:hypothetical protein